MNLNLDRERTQYGNTPRSDIDKGPKFSFFKAPIKNIKSHKSITIRDAYNYIVGPYAKERTEKLRSILADKSRARLYKAANFDYVTFCGEFDVRSNNSVKKVSGLLCIDFDHIEEPEVLFTKLLNDEYFNTVLLFRSPSGDGLKWVIEIPPQELPHPFFFKAVENYIFKTYGVNIDGTGKDISRACFLCYDPNAFINENYL
ncbi:MAG: virulence protein E [Bacteroidales bacterium]|nr:virulence protein E [Bacteroidales bacterium]